MKGAGQGRGNSGVYLSGLYEIQVLDSYNNKTYYDGQAGALYKQSAPLVNACRKPGEWQSYDIIYHPPRFDSDGKVTSHVATQTTRQAPSLIAAISQEMKRIAALPNAGAFEIIGAILTAEVEPETPGSTGR